MAGFPIVGIGASAGGLEALERFFDAVSSNSGMAFVVVQHLSPDYKSMMPELLGKHTSMPVMRAEDGALVQPNHVYLISPRCNLTIYQDRLYLTEQTPEHGLNLPIDIFLRSLAEDQGRKSIGIILSGTGSDGMRGVRAIKEVEGMVMVQDEESAKFDGMPRSAISTGLVDFILPPEAMPQQLMAYVQHPALNKSGEVLVRRVTDDDNLMRLIAHLRRQNGIDFSSYKPNMVVRRIERRMGINQIEDLDDYVQFVRGSSEETNTLCRELLIGVTNFFRDAEAFESLAENALPSIFEENQAEEGVRVWVAGCSTGEEAYSIAILLSEYMERMGITRGLKVFATDADASAIDYAGNGLYPESIAADVNPDRLGRWFTRRGDSYRINQTIRERVVFATHNLLRDPPFTKVNLVCCRNLLIYIEPAVQQKLLGLFSFSLNPGGILFLGKSESIGEMGDRFHSLDSKWKIYRNTAHGRLPVADALSFSTPQVNMRQAQPLGSRMQMLGSGPYLERVLETVMGDFVPPCVLVDERHVVLHLFGDLDPFLRMRSGRASLNLTTMVEPDLSTALGIALHKASRHAKEIVYRDVPLERDGERLSVHLRIRPIAAQRVRDGNTPLYMVFFEADEVTCQPREGDETFDGSDPIKQRIADLENELQLGKENLQATIEELETSNEELQATNEELLASNEELQSTNEELQSVNEELYTVNSEYQSKIQELNDLNADMDNLLLSTDIGTLFLDKELCVRKFTPPVTQVMNLLTQDLGRPVGHIAHRMEYNSFLEDARQVLQGKDAHEREVLTEDGHWVLVRMRPYREAESANHNGVVISFIDIDELRRSNLSLERHRDTLMQVLSIAGNAVLVTDPDGRVTHANERASELMDTPMDHLVGSVLGEDACRFDAEDGTRLLPEQDPIRAGLRGGACHRVDHALSAAGGRAHSGSGERCAS